MSLLAALLSLSALAGPPDWVEGTPAQFPPEKFVTGVGVAEDRAAAEARARAAIAAVFETQIASVLRVREAEDRSVVAGRERSAVRYSASQEVVAATTALLEGAAVAAAWTDPRGQVHVLAVLDRAGAGGLLRKRIDEGDADAASAVARLEKEKDRAAAARVGWRLNAWLGRREALVVRLRALQPSAAVALPTSLAPASEAARRALAAPAFRVEPTGPGAEQIAGAVGRGLLAVGLGTVEARPDADFVVRVEVEAAEPVPSGAWTIARLAARVRVVRAETGEAWAEVSEGAKGTATQPAEATRRAAAALAKQVEERLAEALRKQLERP